MVQSRDLTGDAQARQGSSGTGGVRGSALRPTGAGRGDRVIPGPGAAICYGGSGIRRRTFAPKITMNTNEHDPDLEGLEDYAERADRRPALFFVGRDSEIRTVERLCARALRAIRAGERFEGATLLFQGAPGAGKTALLSELQYRWLGAPATDYAPARSGSGAVLPVVVHWSDLGSEETVVRAVLKAVDSGLDETCRQTRSSEARASAGVAGWFRTGKRSGQTTSPPALTFVELLEAVTSFHGGGWPGPVA